MRKYTRRLSVVLLGALALGLGAAGRAEGVVEFDTAMVFLELNNGTGASSGFGVAHQGRCAILAVSQDQRPRRYPGPRPSEQRELWKHGGSEFFIEGAEPPISEVPILQTLAKFPAGTYWFEGQTVDGKAMAEQGEAHARSACRA